MSVNAELPDYKRPPVVEIIAAVQFAPFPMFGIGQIVAIGRAFDDWEVVETAPAIPPMTEGPPGQPTPQAFFSFGAAPQRVILAAEGARWAAQVQQDRIAVHERKVAERPSFTNVAPKLAKFGLRAGQALGAELFGEAHAADVVEVIYENRIAAVDGGWTSFQDLDQILRVFSGNVGSPPYDAIEQATVGFSYALAEEGSFVGRLRVIGEPQYDEEGQPVLALRVASRRLVRAASLDGVLEACHADIVNGFTSITTDHMHEHWERYR
jgi:hypothetical protein